MWIGRDQPTALLSELLAYGPKTGQSRSGDGIGQQPARRDARLGTRKAYHILGSPPAGIACRPGQTFQDTEIQPEQVWVSDITYIGGRDRNCYLALFTDAYSKKIMGYDVSSSLATDGSLRALNMAIKQRKYKRSLIHHSDRGLQYCSNDYQAMLQKKKIKPSMTESYDPYANAIAERVNGILKQEFLLEKASGQYTDDEVAGGGCDSYL